MFRSSGKSNAVKAYMLAARTAPSTAVLNGVGALLHNTGSEDIYVTQVSWCNAASTAETLIMLRTSTRGTGGTVTSGSRQNDCEYETAPTNVVQVDVGGFVGEPTIISSIPIARFNFAGQVGEGFIMPFPDGLAVPKDTGLAMCSGTTGALVSADVTFWWRE